MGFRDLFTAPPDTAIDDLIAAKGVQAYRPGMERPDHRVMEQIGRERWMQTLHAQRHGLRQVQKRTA